MDKIKTALNELYYAVDNPQEAPERIEKTTELLCEFLEETGAILVFQEVENIISTLNSTGDIESVIYELEVMQNELE